MADGTRFHAARPTIILAGEDDRSLKDGLLEMIVVETTAGLRRCEARFGNWGSRDQGMGFLYFDRRKLEFGKALTIRIGNDLIFDGKITALEAHFLEGAAPEITVLAEDRLQDLRMTRRTRTFADASDADVFSQIAADHGLSPDVRVTGPTHKLLVQLNQSDLAFLRERARAVDAELWVDGATLHAEPRAARNGGSVKLQYGKELLEFSVIADLADQRTSVTVSGWDVDAKDAIEEKAEMASIQAELAGGASGPEILGSAFKTRDEAIVHRVPLTGTEARTRAEAEYRMRARRFVVGRGRAQGNGKLRVGAFVDLAGLGALFEGKYYLVEVRHVFEGSTGIRSEFIAERPGLGQPT